MFLLELPPVGGQKVPNQVAQAPKPKTEAKSEPKAPSGGKDELVKLPLDQVLKGLEAKLAKTVNPNEISDLKARIIEIKAQQLEEATKNGTVTKKDVEDFLKNKPLDQLFTEKGTKNYQRYSTIFLNAYERVMDKENTPLPQKEARLNSFKGLFKEGLKYREYMTEQLKGERELLKQMQDFAKDARG